MSVVTSTQTMAAKRERRCVPSGPNKEYRFRTDTADALTVVCPIVKDQEFNCWSWLLALMGVFARRSALRGNAR